MVDSTSTRLRQSLVDSIAFAASHSQKGACSRVAPCGATDGKTTVFYGQAIRMIVAMNDYTVKGSASIAIVAATAAASGKTSGWVTVEEVSRFVD